jgi:large subunit ribosomal protein L24
MDKFKPKIKKGDTVVVIAGSHKGSSGSVLSIHPNADRPTITIEGVNVRTRYQKARDQEKAQPVKKERPIAYSNVSKVVGDA